MKKETIQERKERLKKELGMSMEIGKMLYGNSLIYNEMYVDCESVATALFYKNGHIFPATKMKFAEDWNLLMEADEFTRKNFKTYNNIFEKIFPSGCCHKWGNRSLLETAIGMSQVVSRLTIKGYLFEYLFNFAKQYNADIACST